MPSVSMQKITLLYDASQAVLSTSDLDEVLTQILKIAREYFHLENAAVLLLDEDTKELSVRSQIGWEEGHYAIRIPHDAGIVGAAATQKRPVYVPDVSLDPRYIPSCDSTRSEVAIPLMVRDEVVGVLDCQSDRLDHFDSETVDLLTLFSTQASMALQNARLRAVERRRALQLEAINAIAQQTTAVLDLKQLLNKVCSLVHQAFKVAHVSILLKDEEELVLRAHHGTLTLRAEGGQRMPFGRGLRGWTSGIGETLVQNGVETSGPGSGLFLETRARMCIPLISYGQTFGMLALDSDEAGTFREWEVAPLESVADICATAIQNAYYVDRVKQLAYRDGLTGIFNRRFFELRMAEELERAQRFGEGMAVIMIDIDQFKRLNDEFGHLLGDEVLRQVSSLLHEQLRKFDVVCRYGGEEFAVLLSQTNPQYAVKVAEKLRSLIERWEFPGLSRPVTISAGVASYPGHGLTRDELIRAADASLYAAKQAGRNRVIPAASRGQSQAQTTGSK